MTTPPSSLPQISDEQRNDLIAAACEARLGAYAPYSKYYVGAAVMTEDGTIFKGVNVENASYGLTNCAERTAIFTAVAAGHRRIIAVAVCTENTGSPCGACRQVMSEFAGDIPVYLSNAGGDARDTTLGKLMPDQFGPEHLPVVE